MSKLSDKEIMRQLELHHQTVEIKASILLRARSKETLEQFDQAEIERADFLQLAFGIFEAPEKRDVRRPVGRPRNVEA